MRFSLLLGVAVLMAVPGTLQAQREEGQLGQRAGQQEQPQQRQGRLQAGQQGQQGQQLEQLWRQAAQIHQQIVALEVHETAGTAGQQSGQQGRLGQQGQQRIAGQAAAGGRESQALWRELAQVHKMLVTAMAEGTQPGEPGERGTTRGLDREQEAGAETRQPGGLAGEREQAGAEGPHAKLLQRYVALQMQIMQHDIQQAKGRQPGRTARRPDETQRDGIQRDEP